MYACEGKATSSKRGLSPEGMVVGRPGFHPIQAAIGS
jgi:hypothetical protein